MAEFKPVLNGPIGGQSWQFAPRTMPYDRPAQFSNPNEALDFMFKRLTQPANTKQLLNIIEAGYPIDILVSGIVTQGFQEGRFGAPIVAQLVGPITIMLWRMAESAGIQPQLSTDKNAKVDFDPIDMMAAEKRIQNGTADKAMHANEVSQKELMGNNIMDRQGFMKHRPKKIMGGK